MAWLRKISKYNYETSLTETSDHPYCDCREGEILGNIAKYNMFYLNHFYITWR